MAITGKKFSELTQQQQIATRVPITGWLVNNLFINPLGKDIIFEPPSQDDFNSDSQVIRLFPTMENPSSIIPGSTISSIGQIIYVINWGVRGSLITIENGSTLLPYSACALVGAFGVFKIEKTGTSEWTISVVENGNIIHEQES